jgi:hypothetical protein
MMALPTAEAAARSNPAVPTKGMPMPKLTMKGQQTLVRDAILIRNNDSLKKSDIEAE